MSDEAARHCRTLPGAAGRSTVTYPYRECKDDRFADIQLPILRAFHFIVKVRERARANSNAARVAVIAIESKWWVFSRHICIMYE